MCWTLKNRRLVSVVLFVAFLPFAVESVAATRTVELRIDNELRSGGKVVKSFTYLIGDDFYSVMEDNGEMIFYDAKKETFTLLHPSLRLQTQLSAVKTKSDIDDRRRRYLSHETPMLAFVAEPKFQSEFDETSGRLSLQSPWFDYVVTSVPFPGPAEAAKAYHAFCDRSCYLNFRINPRSPVPLVRLEVNRILREGNRFPREITLSYFPKGKGLLAKEETVRATHQPVFRLSDDDRRRLDAVAECRRAFASVPFDDYQNKVVELEAGANKGADKKSRTRSDRREEIARLPGATTFWASTRKLRFAAHPALDVPAKRSANDVRGLLPLRRFL